MQHFIIYAILKDMPITKSAKKALRQNLKRRARNRQKKRKIKALIKQAKDFIQLKKTEQAKKLLPMIYKSIDKAVKTGVLKKNTAGRKKAKIAKLINKETKSP